MTQEIITLIIAITLAALTTYIIQFFRSNYMKDRTAIATIRDEPDDTY